MMQPEFQLSTLAPPLHAQLHGEDVSISGVSTDSRSIAKGDLFVALRGDRFNGHDFLSQVVEQGAAAVVSEPGHNVAVPSLSVADTETALGQLGAYNRSLYQGVAVAITGSCGKTSVKNMLSTIFSNQGATLATQGNLNNEIGVPLTLLRLAPEHRYAVIEMGAGKPGDIAYLVALGKPQIAMLLNAMPAHLERMGSLQGIAETKGAILSGLGGQGTAVYPADSEFTPLWRDLAGPAQRLEFSFDATSPVHVSDLQLSTNGSTFLLHVGGEAVQISLPLPGRHSVANAMAAAAGAYAAGVSMQAISASLAQVAGTDGRLKPMAGRDGITLIDDSYNANPGSVKAAIDVLSVVSGRRVLVLGAMGELGEAVDALHAEVGEYAATQGIELLFAIGAHTDCAAAAFGKGATHFASQLDLLDALDTVLQSGDTVLVKGSRSAGMEAVVSALSATGHGGLA